MSVIACRSSDFAAVPIPSATPAPTAVAARGGPFGPGVTETQITLGMTNDLAGIGDTPFGAITTAIDAYLKKNNQEDGGVCSRDVVLLAEDDQHNQDLALEKTKKLVEQDEALAMVGAVDTAIHNHVATYLNDPNADANTSDGVPDLFVSTGWSSWGDIGGRPRTIGFAPDYQTDAKIQATYINQQFAGKKVGIVYQNDELGLDYLLGLQQALATRDLLVSEQLFDPATSDLKAQVLALRDAGAEVVLLALSPAATAQAMVIASGEAYAPRWFISYVNSPSALAREIGGGIAPQQLSAGFALLNGAISTSYLRSAVDEAETPVMLEHKRIMETFDGPEVSTLSVYGQSLAELIVETLSRACDDLTRQGILRAAESVRGFRPTLLVPGVEVNLGPQDHYAIQTLQPIEIEADGTVTQLGAPISLEAQPDTPVPSETPAVFPS